MMKNTPEDLTFFKNMSETEAGRQLSDMLKRVIDFAHDSRSWQEGDTKESAAHAARLLKETILDKISPKGDSKTKINEFE